MPIRDVVDYICIVIVFAVLLLIWPITAIVALVWTSRVQRDNDDNTGDVE